jgi:hypothetical protein
MVGRMVGLEFSCTEGRWVITREGEVVEGDGANDGKSESTEGNQIVGRTVGLEWSTEGC